jgi:hypothetical protein
MKELYVPPARGSEDAGFATGIHVLKPKYRAAREHENPPQGGMLSMVSVGRRNWAIDVLDGIFASNVRFTGSHDDLQGIESWVG